MERYKRVAEDILQQVGYSAPVDVEAIARDLGLVIIRQSMEESVSGMLVIDGDGGTIGVNVEHHSNRQRFTVAHEIGHFLLHRGHSSVFLETSPIFFRDESSAEGSKSREIEANQFAAELLMPQNMLETFLELDRTFDVSNDLALRRLASRFGVSTQALLIRLTRLNLIDG